ARVSPMVSIVPGASLPAAGRLPGPAGLRRTPRRARYLMKSIGIRSLSVTILLAALLALGAAGPTPPDDLVRRGNVAYERGDFARAAGLFDQAAERATHPGLATFNQAVAAYRLARLNEDGDAGLREAAALFRCCLARGDPRRTRALFGLGNCLLHG